MSVQNRFKDYLPDQREYFDVQITEDWDEYDSRGWDRVRRFEVERLFRFARPATVLDVGCGCGFHDREMAGYDFVERVDAIDYSAKSVQKAEEFFAHSKVKRWVSDMEDLDLETLYDLVVSFQVVEHAPDPVEFIKQCARSARPGGWVAAFTVNRLRPYNRKRLRAGKEAELDDPMHKREFSLDELGELGAACGLETVRLFSYGSDLSFLPLGLSIRAGYYFSSMATRLGVIYRKRGG